jgi:hypothetical protein
MQKKPSFPLVTSHLEHINRALLEGEKRPIFLEFLKHSKDRKGIYALYDARGRLYYVGKASDLQRAGRLKDHLKDKHAESWDTMSLFFLSESANMDEIEGLLIAVSGTTNESKGNERKRRIGKDLRPELNSHFRVYDDSLRMEMIYPNKKISNETNNLSKRITPRKLKNQVTQTELAQALGLSQPYVSTMINQDKKNYSVLLRYIREGGYRDRILLLLDKKSK